MKKFRFKLQRVLDYREISESRLMTELTVIRNEYEVETAKLAGLLGLRELCFDRLKRHLSKGSANDIRQTHGYLNELLREIDSQETAVQQVAEREKSKLAEVVVASKDRKVMERLREQEQVAYKREVEYQEQKFLDEIACTHGRRSGMSQDYAPGG